MKNCYLLNTRKITLQGNDLDALGCRTIGAVRIGFTKSEDSIERLLCMRFGRTVHLSSGNKASRSPTAALLTQSNNHPVIANPYFAQYYTTLHSRNGAGKTKIALIQQDAGVCLLNLKEEAALST